MVGMFIAVKKRGEPLDLSELNTATREWTMKAARGECQWVCSDCGASFPKGMPDHCLHGNERCTEIIKRDKDEARDT
jgi:hypothetical protein